MAEKLTQVEKWMNEVRLMRAEAVAAEEQINHLLDENNRLRKMLFGIIDMARECLKDGVS